MSSTTTSLPPIAYPGLILGATSQYTLGPGTHVYNGQIIASLSGRPTVLRAPRVQSSITAPKAKPVLTIPRQLPFPPCASTPSSHISTTNILPSVGSIVLARVLRIRTRQVDIGILCVGSATKGNPTTSDPFPQSQTRSSDPSNLHVCADEWPAVIRREDIRATEKEKVVCAEGFRVGDIVRGVVISLGDQANYYVSTARNELGVLMARSEVSGEVMAPLSWKEFVDPGDGRREGRKVAKPV